MKKIISMLLSAAILLTSLFAGGAFSFADDESFAQLTIDMIENCGFKDIVEPAYDDKEQKEYMIALAKSLAAEAAEKGKDPANTAYYNSSEICRVIMNICEYVNANVKYLYASYRRTGYEVLSLGEGNCMDYALVAYELCRFAGIEAYVIPCNKNNHEILLVNCGEWDYIDVGGGIYGAWSSPDELRFTPSGVRTYLYDIAFCSPLDATIQKYYEDNEVFLSYDKAGKRMCNMTKDGTIASPAANGWICPSEFNYEYKNGYLYLKECYCVNGVQYRGYRTVDGVEHCFDMNMLGEAATLDYSRILKSPEITFDLPDKITVGSTVEGFYHNNAESNEPFEIMVLTKSNGDYKNYHPNATGQAEIVQNRIHFTEVGYVFPIVVSSVTGKILLTSAVKVEAPQENESSSAAQDTTDTDTDTTTTTNTNTSTTAKPQGSKPASGGSGSAKYDNTDSTAYDSGETEYYRVQEVTLSRDKYTYDGKVKKPRVTVIDSRGNIVSPDKYSVTYSAGRKAVGKYSVRVKFQDSYNDSVTKCFVINPKGTSISSVKSGKSSLNVKIKKCTAQTSGYQIQYSTSAKFKNAKTVTVKNTTVNKKITRLLPKKKYYVRVRAYKKSGSQSYYSAWSKAKAVKTK